MIANPFFRNIHIYIYICDEKIFYTKKIYPIISKYYRFVFAYSFLTKFKS